MFYCMCILFSLFNGFLIYSMNETSHKNETLKTSFSCSEIRYENSFDFVENAGKYMNAVYTDLKSLINKQENVVDNQRTEQITSLHSCLNNNMQKKETFNNYFYRYEMKHVETVLNTLSQLQKRCTEKDVKKNLLCVVGKMVLIDRQAQLNSGVLAEDDDMYQTYCKKFKYCNEKMHITGVDDASYNITAKAKKIAKCLRLAAQYGLTILTKSESNASKMRQQATVLKEIMTSMQNSSSVFMCNRLLSIERLIPLLSDVGIQVGNTLKESKNFTTDEYNTLIKHIGIIALLSVSERGDAHSVYENIVKYNISCMQDREAQSMRDFLPLSYN